MGEEQLFHLFHQVVQKIEPHSKLMRFTPLSGGVSAQVTALEFERPDGELAKMIVRQHGEADLTRNPRIAVDEYKLLQFLKVQGLPVPTPYAFDQSGAIFSTPYIVMEFGCEIDTGCL